MASVKELQNKLEDCEQAAQMLKSLPQTMVIYLKKARSLRMAGQFLDIQGISKGKGFAGVMKVRW